MNSRQLATAIALVVPALVVGGLTLTRSIEYGHAPTWWYYADRPLTGKAVIFALVGGAAAAAGTWALTTLVERREVLAVAACVAGGFLLQLAPIAATPSGTPLPLLQNARYTNESTIGTIITDRDNDFYQAARDVPQPDHLLRHWDAVRTLLPLHASTNMPGKVVVYQLLFHISSSPNAVGYMIAVIAALGGLLVYLLARAIFDNRQTAIIAAALYFVVPARLMFLLFANSVTAVLALALFLCALSLVRTASIWLGVLTGVLAYVLVFYDPTPIVLIPTFLALVAHHRVEPLRRLVPAAAATMGAFVVCHLIMLGAYGFNVVSAANFVLHDARAFNLRAHRRYLDFLPMNPIEFVIQGGVIVTVLVLATFIAAVGALLTRRRSFGDTLDDPVITLPLALGATFVWLVLVGTSRGEITRLWIYLAVFFAIAAAGVMQRMPRWLAPTAVFFAFAHGVLAFSTMSFIGPRAICHDCGAVAKHAYQPVLVAVLVAAIAGLGWLLTRRAIAPRGATRSRMIRA